MNYEDASEEKVYKLGRLGEEKDNKLSFAENLEKDLSDINVLLLKASRLSTTTACALIYISFLQIISFVNSSDTRYSSSDNYQELFSVLLDQVRIFPVIQNAQSSVWYFVICYIFSFLEFLIAFLLIFVWIQGGRHRTIYASLSSTLASLHFWVLMTPILEFLIASFKCSNYLATCWTTSHIFNICLFSIVLCLYLILTVFICIYGNDCNPYDPQNPFARFNWNFEAFFAIFRIVLCCYFSFFPSESYIWGFNTIVILGTAICDYYCLEYLPYYNSSASKAFMASTFVLTWIVINFVLSDILKITGIDQQGNTLVALCGILISYPISSSYYKYRKESLILQTSQPHLLDEPTFDTYIYTVVQLTQEPENKLMINKNQHVLNGYLMSLRSDYSDPELISLTAEYFGVSRETTNANQSSLISKKCLTQIPKTIFDKRLSESHSFRNRSIQSMQDRLPVRVCLSYAYYLIARVKNLHMAALQFGAVHNTSSSLAMRFLAYKGKVFVEEIQEEGNKKKVPGKKKFKPIDPRRILEYEAKFARFKTELLEVTTQQRQMWGELLCPIPNLNKVYQIGLKMDKSNKIIQTYLVDLERLNKRNPVTEVIYGRYLGEILGQHEEGEQHYKAGRVNEIDSESINEETLKNDKKCFMSDDCVVVTISAMPESSGRIIKASNSIQKLFDYSPNDLAGHDVKILMPFFISESHSNLVKDFLGSGQSRILGKAFETLAIDKQQYLFKILLYVRQFYDMKYGSIFVGLIRSIAQDQALIVTNEFGRLLGISQSASGELGNLSPTLFKENFLYLFYICPNMFDDSKDVSMEYLNLDGFVTLEFMVPSNLASVAQSIRNEQLEFDPSDFLKEFNQKTQINRECTLGSLKNTRFSKSLNYKDAIRFAKNCKFTKFSCNNGKITIKEITFRRSREKWDESCTTNQSEHKLLLLEPIFSNTHPKTMSKSGMKRLSMELQEKKIDYSKMLGKSHLNTISCSQERNTTFLISLRKAEASAKNGNDKEEEKEKSAIEEDDNDLGNKQKPGIIEYKTLEEHKRNAKNEEETSSVAFVRVSLIKELNYLRNISYTSYLPNSVRRLNCGLLSLCIFAFTLSVAEYIISKKAYEEITQLTTILSLSRTLPFIEIFHAVLAIELLVPNMYTSTVLNENLRNSYNYATIGYLGNYQTLNYSRWKKLELLSYAQDLQRINADLLMKTVGFIDKNHPKEINTLNFSVVFDGFMNQEKADKVQLYSAISLYTDQAISLYYDQSNYIDPSDARAMFIIKNAFNGISNLQKNDDALILIEESQTTFVIRQWVVVSFAAFIGCNSVICAILLLIVLFGIKNDQIKTLKLLSDLNQPSIKKQIDMCTVFINFLQTNPIKENQKKSNESLPIIEEIDSEVDEGTNLTEKEKENNKENDEDAKNKDNDKDKDKGEGEENKEKVKSKERSQNKNKKRKSKIRQKSQKQFSGRTCPQFVKFLAILFILNVYFVMLYLYPTYIQTTIQIHMDEFSKLNKQLHNNAYIYSLVLYLFSTNESDVVPSQTSSAAITNKINDVVLQQNDIMRDHGLDKTTFTSEYSSKFDNIMRGNVCLLLANINATECETIQYGDLTKGLYVANIAFLKTLNEMTENFIYKKGYERTSDYLFQTLNSQGMINMEIIYTKYFSKAYKEIINVVDNSIAGSLNSKMSTSSTLFGFFLIFILITVLVLKVYYVNTLLTDLFASKTMLTTVPIDIILNSPRLRDYIMECSSNIMADITN